MSIPLYPYCAAIFFALAMSALCVDFRQNGMCTAKASRRTAQSQYTPPPPSDSLRVFSPGLAFLIFTSLNFISVASWVYGSILFQQSNPLYQKSAVYAVTLKLLVSPLHLLVLPANPPTKNRRFQYTYY
jgi:hypothetical protein